MEYEWSMGDNDGIMVTNGEIYPQYIIISSLSIGWWCNSHLENMKVNGKDYPIYYGKNMFETTNQLGYPMDTIFTTFCGYDGI